MGRKRKKSVLFFVTENEFLMMKQNAEKTKLSLSEYIRKCCITNSKLIIQDTEYILDLIKEVNNTIEQIIYRLQELQMRM